MNVDVFSETSVGFLKSEVAQLFPKYSQSYAISECQKYAKIQ